MTDESNQEKSAASPASRFAWALLGGGWVLLALGGLGNLSTSGSLVDLIFTLLAAAGASSSFAAAFLDQADPRRSAAVWTGWILVLVGVLWLLFALASQPEGWISES